MQRIVITTGGTGGHIFPALAVAEEIQSRYPGVRMLFLGGEYGPEADLAVKAGLDFVGLPVRGVAGRGVEGLAAAFGMARGFARALRVLRGFGPQLVVGFGGYASFPGMSAACITGRKTALHEQNALPGLANRMLGRFVKRVFLSMPDASGAFAESRSALVGNPVRASIAELHEKRRKTGWEDAEGRAPRLLVLGGSQGAFALNESVLRILDKLLEAGIEIRHQTGRADYERVRAAYREAGAEHARVEAFIDDMAQAYERADLVLSRSGASTLAEITAAGLPAVLVPFPGAVGDHQRHNAAYLRDNGAAMVLGQEEFYGGAASPARLAACILELTADQKLLREMASRSLALARPHAAAQLVDGLETMMMRK